MKTLRISLLATGVFFTSLAIGHLAYIHLSGNHALGKDGDMWQRFSSIATTILACCTEIAMGVVIFNLRDKLGRHWAGIATGAALLLTPSIFFTWLWTSAGLEHAVTQHDKSHVTNAEERAWDEHQARLLADAQRVQAETPLIVSARHRIEDLEAEVTTLIAEAANMDNDGDKSNDRQIAGKVAASESRKADVANAKADLSRLMAEHSALVANASKALADHGKTRGAVLTKSAETDAAKHQFVRWAEIVSSLVPNLSADRALSLVIGVMALLYMLPQWGGLTLISAGLAIEVPKPVEVVPCTAEEKPDEVTEESTPAIPENVVQGTFATMRSKYEGMSRDDLRSMLRMEIRNGNVTMPEGFNLRQIQRMTSGQCREYLDGAAVKAA